MKIFLILAGAQGLNFTGVSSTSNIGTSGNNNGCSAFPKSCNSECLNIDNQGCVVCKCSGSSSVSSSSTGSGSGISGNANGCPPFTKSCQNECMKIDSTGCVVCKCDGNVNVIFSDK